MNAQIVGISPDSVERVKRFGDSIGIKFQLGSDTSGDVRRLYEAQRRFNLGTSRITYVIDGEGVIRGAFHNEMSMSRHIRNTLKTLAAICETLQSG